MKLDDFIADCECCFLCFEGTCIETAMVTITVEGLGIDAETAFGALEFDSETQTTRYSAFNLWTFTITCANGVAIGTLTSGGNTLAGTWDALDPVVGCCPDVPADYDPSVPFNANANFDFATEITISGDGYEGTAVLDGNQFVCSATKTTPPPPPTWTWAPPP